MRHRRDHRAKAPRATSRVLESQAILTRLQLTQNVTAASDFHCIEQCGSVSLHAPLYRDDTIRLTLPSRLSELLDISPGSKVQATSRR